MTRGGGDHHDAVTCTHFPKTVQHEHIPQRPTAHGLLGDRGEGALGHAGVVLDHHMIECACVIATHDAMEGDHRSQICAAFGKTLDFGGEVEGLFLNDDAHGSAPGHWREESDFAHAIKGGLEGGKLLV